VRYLEDKTTQGRVPPPPLIPHRHHVILSSHLRPPTLADSSSTESADGDTPSQVPTRFRFLFWLSVGPRPLFVSVMLYTVGRTPWRGDQPVATLPLTKYSTVHATHCGRLPTKHVRRGGQSALGIRSLDQDQNTGPAESQTARCRQPATVS
jgi:hypothetical protein